MFRQTFKAAPVVLYSDFNMVLKIFAADAHGFGVDILHGFEGVAGQIAENLLHCLLSIINPRLSAAGFSTTSVSSLKAGSFLMKFSICSMKAPSVVGLSCGWCGWWQCAEC